MAKKPNYSMPDNGDRTDHAKVRGKSERDIDYSDIPALNDPVWRGKAVRKGRAASRRAASRRRPLAAE